jgi:hypothetical protein
MIGILALLIVSALLARLFYLALWDKTENKIIQVILYFTPINIIFLIFMVSANIIIEQSDRRKMKRRMKRKFDPVLYEKMKFIDPYGEEDWE